MAKLFKWNTGIKVMCSSCKEKHDESAVEISDIYEDIQGHDVITFECPSCGEKSESKRFG